MRQTQTCLHIEPPEINNGCLHSGLQSAPVIHTGEHASIGEGDDGSLWILVHDPERRPRGRDPGVVLESDYVSFEQNGLVRVLDRRLSQDTIERLISDLTGRSTSIAKSLTKRSQIPAGNYAGIVVEPIDGHYRVHAGGPTAQRFADMQSLGSDRWLVLAGEESILRRELVRQLMPTPHRAAWSMVKHGSRILLCLVALLLVLSLLEPRTIVLTVPAVIALGVLYGQKRSITSWARRRWVEPCVNRTLSNPHED